MEKKKRTRMGIVTNKMSDKVYNFLEEKAQNNDFSPYIIRLVEEDMERRELKEELESIKLELKGLHAFVHATKELFQKQDTPVVYKEPGETLVNLNFVSDEKIHKEGFEESVDLDF